MPAVISIDDSSPKVIITTAKENRAPPRIPPDLASSELSALAPKEARKPASQSMQKPTYEKAARYHDDDAFTSFSEDFKDSMDKDTVSGSRLV